MQLDHNPLYRTAIFPWYDSDLACYLMVAFLTAVLLFAGIGIFVAVTRLEYGAYLWFPLMLAGLSSLVIVKVCLRLVFRNRHS